MKLLIMQFSPTSRQVISLYSNRNLCEPCIEIFGISYYLTQLLKYFH
jgi:hypothetical protein